MFAFLQGKQVVKATNSRARQMHHNRLNQTPFFEFCPTQPVPSPPPILEAQHSEPALGKGSLGTDSSASGIPTPRRLTAPAEMRSPGHHSTLSADCAFQELTELTPSHLYDSTPVGEDFRSLNAFEQVRVRLMYGSLNTYLACGYKQKLK